VIHGLRSAALLAIVPIAVAGCGEDAGQSAASGRAADLPAPTRDTTQARAALRAGRRACAGRSAAKVRRRYLSIARERLRSGAKPVNRRTVRLASNPPAPMRSGRPAAGLAAAIYATTRPQPGRRDAFNGCIAALSQGGPAR
jgi:hypothetical protein